MLSKVRTRFDSVDCQDGKYRAIWSLKVPGCHPVWDEYLVCLYDLKGMGDGVPVVKYREGMTHEFMVVAVAPDVRIDFDRNVFEQSTLVPLMGPNHGFQFKAESNEAARARVEVCVNSILNGSLSPEDQTNETWKLLFQDGVALVTS